jgi:hypothetical protein
MKAHRDLDGALHTPAFVNFEELVHLESIQRWLRGYCLLVIGTALICSTSKATGQNLGRLATCW